MAHIRDFVNCFIFMLQKAIRRARARRPRQATVLIIKTPLRYVHAFTRQSAVPISVVPQSAPSTVGARSGLGFGSSATIGCLPERTTLRGWVLALALDWLSVQSPERTTSRAEGSPPRPVLSSPKRRRAGETNMHVTCMQLACLHASHACTEAYKTGRRNTSTVPSRTVEPGAPAGG